DPVAQDLGVRDYGRERRAQVVRDVGQELRLERVPCLQIANDARGLAQARVHRSGIAVAQPRRGFDVRHCLEVTDAGSGGLGEVYRPVSQCGKGVRVDSDPVVRSPCTWRSCRPSMWKKGSAYVLPPSD